MTEQYVTVYKRPEYPYMYEVRYHSGNDCRIDLKSYRSRQAAEKAAKRRAQAMKWDYREVQNER